MELQTTRVVNLRTELKWQT